MCDLRGPKMCPHTEFERNRAIHCGDVTISRLKIWELCHLGFDCKLTFRIPRTNSAPSCQLSTHSSNAPLKYWWFSKFSPALRDQKAYKPLQALRRLIGSLYVSVDLDLWPLDLECFRSLGVTWSNSVQELSEINNTRLSCWRFSKVLKGGGTSRIYFSQGWPKLPQIHGKLSFIFATPETIPWYRQIA